MALLGFLSATIALASFGDSAGLTDFWTLEGALTALTGFAGFVALAGFVAFTTIAGFLAFTTFAGFAAFTGFLGDFVGFADAATALEDGLAALAVAFLSAIFLATGFLAARLPALEAVFFAGAGCLALAGFAGFAAGAFFLASFLVIFFAAI